MSEQEQPQDQQKHRTEEHDEGRANRARLASGFLVIKNAAISIGGSGAIAVMGLIAVPILVERLGPAKFGIISLAWIVIGYASILDLGLGRALTKMTADRLGAGRPQDIPGLFWSALFTLAAIGVVTGGVIAALSGVLAHDVLSIGPNLVEEAELTFILLGATVPFVLCSTALQGNLEARQRFDLTNAITVPLSVLSFFGPVMIALFTTNLALVVSAVCLSRVSATLIFIVVCMRVDPSLRGRHRFDRARVRELIRFGGWVTVAAVLTGVMMTFDRVLIGATVSAAAVAFYATPYEISKQCLFVSATFAGVLFPGFAANVGRDPERTESLFNRGVRATFVGLFPLVLIASVLSYEILHVWINREFAENGSPILQLLPLGILINGLAFVAFALVQSTRPDMIAKLAAIELPVYLGLLWLLLQADGIRGAAIGFVLRALFDTTMLYYFTHRLGLVRSQLLFRMGRMVAVGLVVIALGMLLPSTPTRIAYIALVLACFFPFAWLRILTVDEKLRLREKYRSIRSSGRLRLKRSAPDTA